MDIYLVAVFFITNVFIIILFLFQYHKLTKIKDDNQQLQEVIDQLDTQAKLIVKTDFALNKVQEELDKKITGLYTLHELGRKISSTVNIEDLFSLINQPFVQKLGFSKAIIMLKEDEALITKTYIGYTENEIKKIAVEITKQNIIPSLFKNGKFMLVNTASQKIDQEESLLDLFRTESFLSVPIIVKNAPVGLIVMGTTSTYSKLTEGDAELLSILASQISNTLENAKLYAELFSSHQELERKVKERTFELAKLNEELNRLNKVKSDFISAVSHELRTPLTSIKGYASILISGKLGELQPAQKERLEKIDKHTNSLTHLINNLLDIARIESGKIQMDIKDISLKELIDSTVDIITPQIKEKNISLKIQKDPAIENLWADQSQLERVFLNLLSNAVKFTPEKGIITLSMKDKDQQIEISVKDTGIGIPKQDAEKVFQEFFRADNALDQKTKGTGLGLSLVKKIIEAHNGRIWFESELNKGTTFTFTLPKGA